MGEAKNTLKENSKEEYPYTILNGKPLPEEFYNTFVAAAAVNDWRIVAHNRDAEIARQKAIDKGFPKPVIQYIPHPGRNYILRRSA